jgi:hypothetical protein
MLHRVACCAFVIAGSGCDDGLESYGDDVQDVQVPPRGYRDLRAWLAAGHYLTWHCEPERHASRAPSPHGQNRICNNDVLHAAADDAPFPVGSASVKELFNGAGEIRLFAVYRKAEVGTGGDSWYWYEGFGDDVAANGEGETSCTNCHKRAAHDYVFTVVPE